MADAELDLRATVLALLPPRKVRITSEDTDTLLDWPNADNQTYDLLYIVRISVADSRNLMANIHKIKLPSNTKQSSITETHLRMAIPGNDVTMIIKSRDLDLKINTKDDILIVFWLEDTSAIFHKEDVNGNPSHSILKTMHEKDIIFQPRWIKDTAGNSYKDAISVIFKGTDLMNPLKGLHYNLAYKTVTGHGTPSDVAVDPKIENDGEGGMIPP